MQNKVLELKITEDSPLRNKALNQHMFLINPYEENPDPSVTTNAETSLTPSYPVNPLIALNEPNSSPEIITNSPTFEAGIDFFQVSDGDQKTNPPSLKAAIENLDSSINHLDGLKLNCKELEDLIEKNKIIQIDKKIEIKREKDNLMKAIEKIKIESKFTGYDLLKVNSNKIDELRKDLNASNNDLHAVKKRIYSIELDIKSLEEEIEFNSMEIKKMESLKKRMHDEEQSIISNAYQQNEMLRQENKNLNQSTLELLAQALELVN